MNSTRREFFKKLSLISAVPFLKPQLLFATENKISSSDQPILVFIFLRGAQDGLSVLNPIGEENYAKWRPNISLKAKESEAILIDQHFQINPAMKSLRKHWDNKNLAFITEFGNPLASRSHFDAQDLMESGSPGSKNIEDGFLNRILNQMTKKDIMTAIALQSSMPRILKGKNQTLSMASLKDFRPPKSQMDKTATSGFEEMYQQATDKVFRGVGEETFESINTIKARAKRTGSVTYPKSKLSDDLKDIATIINSDLGLSIAVTEMGGWDTHVNQGSTDGQFKKRLEEFSEAVDAFALDIEKKFSNTIIVACTEFGRTAHENGNKGTDHGHGSVAFVLGGNINGGKIYGKWSGLQTEKLYEERDIQVSTDYRDLMSEIFSHHLKINDLKDVFPGFTPNGDSMKGLVRSKA